MNHPGAVHRAMQPRPRPKREPSQVKQATATRLQRGRPAAEECFRER